MACRIHYQSQREGNGSLEVIQVNAQDLVEKKKKKSGGRSNPNQIGGT